VLLARSHQRAYSQLWSQKLEDPLDRIRDRTVRILQSLIQMRPDSPCWRSAMDAVQSLAESPTSRFLRPQLVLLGKYATEKSDDCLLVENPGVEEFAAAVELQHLFMLVHDDVMDHGTLRRGMPTVNAALHRSGLGSEVVSNAVTVVGDILFSRAAQMLVSGTLAVADKASSPAEREAIMSAKDLIFDSSCTAGVAQFEDILGWNSIDSQVNSDPDSFVRQFMYDKSASHTFVAPLLAGLRLSGGSSVYEEAASSWGRHAGLAFQGLDDVIDLVSEPMITGKDAFQDIQENRLSLPLIMLKGLCEAGEWQEVQQMMGSVVQYGERRFIFELMNKYNLVPRTLEWVDRELGAAESLASTLPDDIFGRGLRLTTKGLHAHAASVHKEYSEREQELDLD